MYIKKKETKKYNQTPFFELFNTTDLTTQDIKLMNWYIQGKFGFPNTANLSNLKFHVKHVTQTIIIPVK